MSLRSLLPLLLLLGVGCVPSHEGHGHEGPDDGHDRQDEPPPAAAHHAEHSEDGHQEGVVELDPAAAETAGIRAEPATLRALLPELRTTGRVAFNENRLAHVGPHTEGRVTEVRADLGASLSSGQVVAILDSGELGRAPAALAGDDLVLSIRDRADHDGLHDTLGFNTLCQFLQGLWFHIPAGLVLATLDKVYRQNLQAAIWRNFPGWRVRFSRV